MPYIILQSDNSNELAKGVSHLMTKDWLPTGGVTISPVSLMPLVDKYSQAMYKTSAIAKDEFAGLGAKATLEEAPLPEEDKEEAE